MNYEALRRDFTGNGNHRYHQIWRDDHAAVYEQFNPADRLLGYEVIVIRRQTAQERFGKQLPAKELYPSSEEWGQYAWTLGNKSSALDLGQSLSQQCQKGGFKGRTR